MFWLVCLLITVAVYFHLKGESGSEASLYRQYYKAENIIGKIYKKQNYIDVFESNLSLYAEPRHSPERLGSSGGSATIAAAVEHLKPVILTATLLDELPNSKTVSEQSSEPNQKAKDNPMQQDAEENTAEHEDEQAAQQPVEESSGVVSDSVERPVDAVEVIELDENGHRISKLAQYQAQEEMPIALVQDEPMSVLPKDLYIPPEALMVILEAFEGPLDLLLYLIRRQNLDVLDIPIADITKQYMHYIELMEDLDLEVAAEYLLMAAMLAEIKSRMLLPRPEEEDEESDPRAELVRRLQEYERYKQAAQDVGNLPRMERDIFPVSAEPPEIERRAPEPDVDMKELMIAFQEVLQRADMFTTHQIRREPLSVRERMSILLSSVSDNSDGFTEFTSLFTAEEGRMGVVVTFLAVLELVKESMIDFVQSEPFAPIYLKPAGSDLEMPASTSSEFD